MPNDTPEPLSAILAEMRDEMTAVKCAGDIQSLHETQDLLRDFADRIEAAAKREAESLRAKMESEKRWACEYFTLARRREDALAHCKQYAQKIERENDEGETRLDAEEIIATVDNEFAGIRPERAPGNAAAMREALEKCAELGDQIDNWLGSDEATVWNCRNERSDAHNIMLTARAALAAPARNCDVGTADDLHAAFVKHCDACDPPGGCCHRMDPRGMLDTNCASILKCFARFVLAKKEGGAK